VAYEYEKYQPWQRERFNTAPGLTGLWQVSGKNNTTFTEMIQLDIRYSRTKTLWLDLKIILKTIPALLVQMWESRMRRKPAGRPSPAKKILADQSGNECCLQKATLISVVGAGKERTQKEV
jgi:hypothetical protein